MIVSKLLELSMFGPVLLDKLDILLIKLIVTLIMVPSLELSLVFLAFLSLLVG